MLHFKVLLLVMIIKVVIIGAISNQKINNPNQKIIEQRRNEIIYPNYNKPNRIPYGSKPFRYGYYHPAQYYNQAPIRPGFVDSNNNNNNDRPENIMDILATVAANDKLRCIPRILCELSSGALSKSRQSDNVLSSLPLNINLESFLRLLSVIDVANTSPIPIFAKAAILGYISKGNSESCLTAYPACPREPEKLVHYLNNYNGGFFRFFNGINLPNNGHQSGPEQRILNKPITEHFPHNNIPKVQFGRDIPLSFPHGDTTSNQLTFPKDDIESIKDYFGHRRPKELIRDYQFLINNIYHTAKDNVGNLVFPPRTGTGDFRLDAQESYVPSNNNNPSFKFPFSE